MRRIRQFVKRTMVTLLGATITSLLLFTPACQTTEKGAAGENASAADDMSLANLPIRDRGGAQLWGDNCGRCHNVRDPTEFTDEGWDVVAHHMRVRANLTAYEHKAILEFLQSAN